VTSSSFTKTFASKAHVSRATVMAALPWYDETIDFRG